MYRIFIVEDDAAIAQAVCEQAESWALEARCVSDFRRVAEEAAAYGPHLILLDISLPFFDGYHWCRQIRRTSRVPIIFLSSAADNMNIVMAMNMGADDFIAKPFDLDVLTAKVVTDFLLDLKARGRTVIVSTHIFSLIEKVCDRVGVIIAGQMVQCGSLAEVCGGKSLEDRFFDLYAERVGDIQ